MVLSRTLRGVSLCAAVPIAAGSLALLIADPAHAASAGGVATLAPPGDTAATPLRSGGSASLFTVALPARASCSGDTAHDGYHVYSYLERKGTDLSTVRFVQGPSAGYGIVNTTSTYYGAINTAFKTGQIVGVPNDFTWGSLVRSGGGPLALSQLLYDGSTGVWETGLACATAHGAVSNDWNTQVTFDADAGDARGFDWTVDPSTSTSASTSALPNSVGGTWATSPSGSTSTTGAPARPVAVAGTGSSTAGPQPGGSTSVGATANAPAPTGSAPAGAVDTAGGADLPVIAILAAAVLVVGAGIAALLKALAAR